MKARCVNCGTTFETKGKKAPEIIAKLTAESPEAVLEHIEKEGKFMNKPPMGYDFKVTIVANKRIQIK